MTYGQLKQGAAFQLVTNGPVFIRCRGGFRPGRGGELYRWNNRKTPIIPFSLG